MELQDETGLALVFTSHNLAVVEHVAQEVLVMYCGRGAGSAAKAMLFAPPLHTYTQTLLGAAPAVRASDRRVRIPIVGEPPSPLDPPSGCAFRTRCPRAEKRSADELPALCDVGQRHMACHFAP